MTSSNPQSPATEHPDDFDALLTAYALNELAPGSDEYLQVQARLADPGPKGQAARAELDALRTTATDLTAALTQEPTPSATPAPAPAPGSQAESATPQPNGQAPAPIPIRHWPRRLAAAASLAAAAALGIAVFWGTSEERSKAAPDTLAMQHTDPSPGIIQNPRGVALGPRDDASPATKTAPETRVYDIRDLLVQVPNFTDGPEFDLEEALESQNHGGGGGNNHNLFDDDDFSRATNSAGAVYPSLFGDADGDGTSNSELRWRMGLNRELGDSDSPSAAPNPAATPAPASRWTEVTNGAWGGAVVRNDNSTSFEYQSAPAQFRYEPDAWGINNDNLFDHSTRGTLHPPGPAAHKVNQLHQVEQLLSVLMERRAQITPTPSLGRLRTPQEARDYKEQLERSASEREQLDKQIRSAKEKIATFFLKATTETYDHVEDNPFLAALDHPLSTFSVDVDTAGYANVRRFLEQGQLPPAGAVRIEEMINYFDYGYEPPAVVKEAEDAIDTAPFSAHVEVTQAPWSASGNRLIRIGLKGVEVATDDRSAANLVFLLDVSGSMKQPNKLPLVKAGMKKLVENLRMDDRIAIVVYAGASGLVLDSTSDHDAVLAAIDDLVPGGSTHGEAGIELAYQIATQNQIPGGVNRVILCTDGDFNVGITDRGSLTRLIEDKASAPETPTYLTVLGFGTGNLKDATLEELTKAGDGNYGYIDSLAEAEKLLAEQVNATLLTIAKDVKVQVEFNPKKVAAYRLIGYENRLLAKEDFNNDVVDAGDIGAGHTVTALYEVALSAGPLPPAEVKGNPPAPALTAEELQRIEELEQQISRLQRSIVRLQQVVDRSSAKSGAETRQRRRPRSEGHAAADTLEQNTRRDERHALRLAAQRQQLAAVQKELNTLKGLKPGQPPSPNVDPLKYQKPTALSDAAESDELLTLKLRYKAPDAAKSQGTSKLLEFPVVDAGTPFDQASQDTQFAAAVAGFGMLLRGSPHAGGLDFERVEEMATVSADPWLDRVGRLTPDQLRRQEFIRLVHRAAALSADTPQPPEIDEPAAD